MIEQQQLAALDVMSNPVFQAAREHLLSAKHYIETGNTDGAVSELFILRQLKILHEQGMMTMKLPMTRDLNSTFYSAEIHLLAAGEALNVMASINNRKLIASGQGLQGNDNFRRGFGFG